MSETFRISSAEAPVAPAKAAPAEREAPRKRKSSKHDRVRPPAWRTFTVVAGATVALSIYLFVSAPPPLAAQTVDRGVVPIQSVFSILEAENDAARALWTQEIVDRGKLVGLAFDETWRDDHVHAGPLPALFLRETSKHLERTGLRLSLFLGSRYPINAANQFTGQQSERFAELEQTGAPQFFYEPATKLHTAMFSDRAIVEACVTCHNEHAESPKTDWKLHDLMGATTWMYPEELVSVERAVQMVGALRSSIRGAYASYLKKVETFPKQPEIGERWPRNGFYLPSEEAFMRELARRTSSDTMRALIDPRVAESLAAEEAAGGAASSDGAVRASGGSSSVGGSAASSADDGSAGVGGSGAGGSALAGSGAGSSGSSGPSDSSGLSGSSGSSGSPVLGSASAASFDAGSRSSGSAGAPAGFATLVIRSSRTTRVTVDHEGTRLLVARIPSGGTSSLTSKPPLRVKLGNPDGVQLEYNGKLVDLATAPRPAERTEDFEIILGGSQSEKR
ncbi:MAG: RodZ domain-containing protein [Kofleriaceae bacterium]